MKNGCPLFTALFIDGSGGNVTIVVCRAVGDGWLADRLPVWMGLRVVGRASEAAPDLQPLAPSIRVARYPTTSPNSPIY